MMWGLNIPELIILIPFLLIPSIVFILLVILIVYAIKALRRHLRSAGGKQEETVRKTLGETLREKRTDRGLTQELVAESLGVSRQAVSKWESGKTDPSTANLLALADLYGMPIEELLCGCASTRRSD